MVKLMLYLLLTGNDIGRVSIGCIFHSQLHYLGRYDAGQPDQPDPLFAGYFRSGSGPLSHLIQHSSFTHWFPPHILWRHLCILFTYCDGHACILWCSLLYHTLTMCIKPPDWGLMVPRLMFVLRPAENDWSVSPLCPRSDIHRVVRKQLLYLFLSPDTLSLFPIMLTQSFYAYV